MTLVFRNPERQARRKWLQLPETPGGAFIVLFWTWWALLAIFNTWPQIDIATAHLFFAATACTDEAKQICGSFPYSDEHLLRIIRRVFFQLPYVTAIVLLVMLFACYQQHGATFDAARVRKLKVALGTFVIGPGLLINGILKAFSGRPRPYETDLFGGPLPFVDAGSFAGKCIGNCSFISGEAASAGWLFCLIFLIPQPARSALALPIAAISFLMTALRVAFGGHYLSDVTLGWLSTLVIFTALLALSEKSHHQKKSGI
ncbi:MULTISPECIES: phosphatase PAP2 family protein [unclassified Sinorhizobium]|uniref:phosphatase PAP2 family protein n=1 Tax=unclassified Sinorhizobium TaxID=2613772 RepID=UPI0035246920